MVRDTRNSKASRGRGLFRREYIDMLLQDPKAHITPLRGSKLWQVSLLEMWLQTHAACGPGETARTIPQTNSSACPGRGPRPKDAVRLSWTQGGRPPRALRRRGAHVDTAGGGRLSGTPLPGPPNMAP